MITLSFEQEGVVSPYELEKVTVQLPMVRICPPLGFFVNSMTNSWLYVCPKEIKETSENIKSKMYLIMFVRFKGLTVAILQKNTHTLFF
jgi:hypothetical protein